MKLRAIFVHAIFYDARCIRSVSSDLSRKSIVSPSPGRTMVVYGQGEHAIVIHPSIYAILLLCSKLKLLQPELNDDDVVRIVVGRNKCDL